MINRCILLLMLASACASPVGVETDPFEKVYKDKLITAQQLSQEDLIIFRNFIPYKIKELIDHAGNATNMRFADSFRDHSREMILSNIEVHKNVSEHSINDLISILSQVSLEDITVDSLLATKAGHYSAAINFQGSTLLHAFLSRRPKTFGKDTMMIWDIQFQTLGSHLIPTTRK